jgi:hypothetical protein
MHVKRIMANPEPKNMLVSTSGIPSGIRNGSTGDVNGEDHHNNHELTTKEVPIEVVALVATSQHL